MDWREMIETLEMVCSEADYSQQQLKHCRNNCAVVKRRDASEHCEELELGYYYLKDEVHTDYHPLAATKQRITR